MAWLQREGGKLSDSTPEAVMCEMMGTMARRFETVLPSPDKAAIMRPLICVVRAATMRAFSFSWVGLESKSFAKCSYWFAAWGARGP